MHDLAPGRLLWTPTEAACQQARMRDYMRWLAANEGHDFADYPALWRWSVADLEGFWGSLARYFQVRFHRPAEAVLGKRSMPGARFFPGAKLNYAEHALSQRGPGIAVVYRTEDAAPQTLSWDALRAQVARARAGLVGLGVGPGDAVVALLPNCPEALVAFLATASLGALWSSCSPEFGADSVLERFRQLAPKVLISVDGYRYAGKRHDRRQEVTHIAASLATLEAHVVVPRLDEPVRAPALRFEDLCAEEVPLSFASCDFDQPLWVLFSSGTTGLPKGIVHGHGGILLEHLKALSLHSNLGPGSRFFWFTTTGWMMWNYLIGGLLVGATVSLYEGHPGYPDGDALFRYAAEDRITYFGTSAPYLLACEKQGLDPKSRHDLSALVGLGSTGAPLPASGFEWVYQHVHSDLLLSSVSGGTDMCTAFLLSCPLQPVRAGEIQCAGLGVASYAWDEHGTPVVGKVGELVITEPMPSMPLYFVGDADGSRMHDSYFAQYPGVWRHGDFAAFTSEGSAVVYGRSDATLNRGGVRVGTAELYRVVDALPEIGDSLVVDTGALTRDDRMWLFVVLAPGAALDTGLMQRIRDAVRQGLSPRHVPDSIVAVPELPRTLNGKKLEVPVKRLLMGVPRHHAVQEGTLANPVALDALLDAAARSLQP